jgi:hypothetical protein
MRFGHHKASAVCRQMFARHIIDLLTPEIHESRQVRRPLDANVASNFTVTLMAHDRSLEARIAAICFISLTWPIVLARCYVRVCVVKAFGADDWCMLGALVSSIAV